MDMLTSALGVSDEACVNLRLEGLAGGLGDRCKMEGSFSSRVEQAFGALGSSVCWSVSEEMVERRKWRSWEKNCSREDPCCGASYYQEFVRLGGCEKPGSSWEDDLDGLGSGGHGDAAQGRAIFDEAEGEEEERHMRMMVGMDSTLDFEDEEDLYDKVAVGREGAGDRMYMKEVNGGEERVNTFNVLPCSLKELKGCSRDPRANHLAARERLEEDAREAACVSLRPQETNAEGKVEKLDKKRTSDVWEAASCLKKPCPERKIQVLDSEIQLLNENMDHAPLQEEIIWDFEPPSEENHTSKDVKLFPSERSMRLASTKKPVKRVRFAVDVSEDDNDSHKSITHVMEEKQGFGCPSVVPDYVKNPSKYIHYTLDWSDEDDEKLNVEAFEASRQLLVQPGATLKQVPIELPQRIEFRPKAKISSPTREGTCHLASGEGSLQIARPVGIAAGYEFEEHAENAACLSNSVQEMDVDDGIVTTEKFTKGLRKYRSRSSSFCNTSD